MYNKLVCYNTITEKFALYEREWDGIDHPNYTKLSELTMREAIVMVEKGVHANYDMQKFMEKRIQLDNEYNRDFDRIHKERSKYVPRK